MNIQRLNLTNFRGIQRLELEFQPGINVIAGKNGVGKSGILESMAVVLSQLTYETGRNRERRTFEADDVRNGSDFLQADLICELEGVAFSASLTKNREQLIVSQDDEKPEDKKVYLRDKPHFEVQPNDRFSQWNDFKRTYKIEPLLAVYYATNRAYLRQISPSSGRAKSDSYAGALTGKFVDLKEFAAWLSFLNSSHAAAHSRHIQQHLQDAITRFLPNFSKPRVEETEKIEAGKIKFNARLFVQKDGQEFALQQLSDGERGILAIVLDLARRLALSYPNSNDPLSEGKAVVLIDEIDLHLHPGWQRDIVSRLEATFPQCQFILTTHSPQVLGEVPANNLIYLKRNAENIAREAIGETFGRDVSYVVSEIMDTPARNVKTERELKHIFDLIQDADFEEAHHAIENLRNLIGDEPELDRAEVRMEFLEGDAE